MFSTPRAGPVCHHCRQFVRRSKDSTSPSGLQLASQQRRQLSRNTRQPTRIPFSSCQKQPSAVQPLQRQRRAFVITSPLRQTTAQDQDVSDESLPTLHARVDELADVVLQHPALPSEEDVSKALEEYGKIARNLLSKKAAPLAAVKPPADGTATSALLSSVKEQQSENAVTKSELLDFMSDRALEIVQHGPVFLTSSILKSYISLQSLLGRPESFPTVLDLYRFKPAPRSGKAGSITYTSPNPDKPAAAVPPGLADAAIDAAIASRYLPLVLATIDATYCTTAYKRSKFLRSALFPLAGLVLTPPAAYTLATRFSDWQTTMDSTMATQVAMAGILTYTTAVSTVGYVALTTANDQMKRVTWASGMPLWERWVREEERGAIDKVAQAWGLRSRDKWGEEEGDEWDTLREWIGLRGMMLDRVELMDGME